MTSGLLKVSNWNRWLVIFSTAIGLLVLQSPVFAGLRNKTRPAPEQYLALSLAKKAGKESHRKILDRHGIPFLEEILPLATGGLARVDIGAPAKRIFLLETVLKFKNVLVFVWLLIGLVRQKAREK